MSIETLTNYMQWTRSVPDGSQICVYVWKLDCCSETNAGQWGLLLPLSAWWSIWNFLLW